MKKQQEKYVFKLLNENTKPTIQNVKFPKSYSIPCIDEIYDEEDDEPKIIRYAIGERNLFLDDQYDPDMRKRAQIIFYDGYLIVDKRQKLLLEFLRKSNGNADNPNRMPGKKAYYMEVKPGETAKESMKVDRKVMEAKQAAYNLELDELIGYARTLGFDVNRDPAEIRYALSVYAEKNPTTFLEGLDSPTTKRKFYIYQALDRGLITTSRAENSVRWGDSKQPIVQAPVGQDPLDYLVEFTFDAKGESVYERLRSLMEPKTSKKGEESNNSELVDMTGVELLKLAKEAGVVKFSGAAITFNGKTIDKGYDKSGAVVDETPTLKRQLIKAIEEA